MDFPDNRAGRAALVLSAVVLTTGAYFLSSGLHRVWWLAWLAPLPILCLAPKLRVWDALAVAFVARALAGLDFWNYLRYVVQFPLGLELVTILIPAACFAFAAVLFRGLLRKGNPWLAALAFSVVIVAAEYLFSLSQGTFLNTGYTQLENLPILQLASVTGLWGISFTVNLLPAAVAALVTAPAKLRLRMATALVAYYACVLTYGFVRLNTVPSATHPVLVGLVETHAGKNIFPPDEQTTLALMHNYADQIKPLAAQGAAFVVLPEMTALIPDNASGKIDALFQQTARDAHVQVLIGIIHVTDKGAYNEGRLYSADGAIETVYRKHHLVPTWEARSTPGSEISVLPQPSGKIGIQICRDLDYPELSRRYAHHQVGLILAPAWDQGVDVDARWHGHLALMRAVEDGFTLVRDAKVGLLTASDDRGRILAEQSTRPDGAFTTMLAAVPVRYDPTLYQKWGDWFAWMDLVAAAALLAFWLAN
jgi:apolipoprotein N-acyltransferase